MSLSVNINVCRVCMNANSGVSLFDDDSLYEKFLFTTRLKTNIRDDIPSLICNKCQARLRISYDFIKLAHESEKNLKAFLAKINKDFQLVANNTNKDKNDENEDDEDLVSAVLEEEYDDKIKHEPKETSKRPSLVENSTSTTSLLVPIATERRNKSVNDASENQKQFNSKKPKHAVEETGDGGTNDTSSKLRNLNKESKASELVPEVPVVLEDDSNLQNFSSAETQHPAALEPEIQILDYSDEDSQVELEILEENLQQSEDTHSSHGDIEGPTNDGFLKEYQTMLEEGDEYLEDNNVMATDRPASTNNEDSLYDGGEGLLDGGDNEDLEINAMVVETDMDYKEFIGNAATTQNQSTTIHNVGILNTTTTTENMQTGENNRGKNKRSLGGTKVTTKGGKATNLKRFFCYKCNRDFTTKTNLTRHMISHEGKRPFQCSVCNKSFSQNVTLKQHMYTHTGEKPYQCEICARGFTQCKSLVFHLRRHTGEKPFPCEKCGALFRQKDGLKTHILKRHTIKSKNGNTKLITCAICKQDFADNNSLQEHMKKHVSDYVRVDSAMSFSNREANKDDNNQVLLEVIGEDPLHDKPTFFLIEPSSESASDINPSAHVVDLMTTSALEPSRAKKFQCRKCFKCFAIKNNLIRHLATHDMGTEHFPCKLCELSFSTKQELREHTLSEHNSSEKLCKCELCQAGFSCPEELEKYSHLQHAFKCVICPNIQFTSRRFLSEHMMEHELNDNQYRKYDEKTKV